MLKRALKLKERECVKRYGLGHLMAHALGIQMVSRCLYANTISILTRK